MRCNTASYTATLFGRPASSSRAAMAKVLAGSDGSASIRPSVQNISLVRQFQWVSNWIGMPSRSANSIQRRMTEIAPSTIRAKTWQMILSREAPKLQTGRSVSCNASTKRGKATIKAQQGALQTWVDRLGGFQIGKAQIDGKPVEIGIANPVANPIQPLPLARGIKGMNRSKRLRDPEVRTHAASRRRRVPSPRGTIQTSS